MVDRSREYPLGAAVTLESLTGDVHEVGHRLRAAEPVSWVPAIGGWLVTRRDLAVEVMRGAERFTVDDPRFTTGQVVGRSMLSLDGPEHRRHRTPFVRPFRRSRCGSELAAVVAAEVEELTASLAGTVELRSRLCAPLAARVIARVLGLDVGDADLLGWYHKIVAAVDALSRGDESHHISLMAEAGRAMDELGVAIGSGGLSGFEVTTLDHAEVRSNTAVVLFGAIETVEGALANLIWHLLTTDHFRWLVEAVPGHRDERIVACVEESLRLEPAACAIDRYTTTDLTLGSATITAGELVRVSLAAANRDPAHVADPDRFTPQRPGSADHLTFVQGPHACIGMHLARVEAQVALAHLVETWPKLRLVTDETDPPSGLIFRKPNRLTVNLEAR